MRLSTLFLAAVLGACGTPDPEITRSAPDYRSDIETITAMSNARAKAFNEGNSAEIARYFAEDAFLMAPQTESLRGKEAVKTYYQGIFDEFHTVLESGYEDVVVDGDLAYGRGFAKVRLVSKSSGDTTFSASKYLNILEKREGEWITTHDIWNDNQP